MGRFYVDLLKMVVLPFMMATIIAGFWSLISGTFFLMTLRAAGVLA